MNFLITVQRKTYFRSRINKLSPNDLGKPKLLIQNSPRDMPLAMGKGVLFGVYVRGSPHKLGEPVVGETLRPWGDRIPPRLWIVNLRG